MNILEGKMDRSFLERMKGECWLSQESWRYQTSFYEGEGLAVVSTRVPGFHQKDPKENEFLITREMQNSER